MAMKPLPPFSDTSCCAKCGGDDVMTDYHKDAHEPVCVLAKELSKPECCKVEHLERVCRRCHYKWAEAILGEGVTTIAVTWADEAVNAALTHLVAWRDGDGRVEKYDQTVLVAIDALRTVSGQED